MPWTATVTRATGFPVTAAVWNSEHVDNLNFLREVNYTAFTADVSITATTVGTANQVVSSGAITYEAVPHLIEFYSPQIVSAAVAMRLILRDGTTVLGTLTQFNASIIPMGFMASTRITPTAASHTYNIAGWNAAAGTWTVKGGTGGAAGDATTYLNGYLRIRRVPT